MDALLIPTFFCPKAWAGMAGDEKTRHCSYCNKHVHNLDALSSVSDRLALLSSPAAHVCARYRVAIRRPAKGWEKSYYRHLLKYGLGVALGGSVLLVLWEMEGKAEKEKYYRTSLSSCGRPMPKEYYEERQRHVKGEMTFSSKREREIEKAIAEARARQDAGLTIDKKIMDSIIHESAAEPVFVTPNKKAGD